MGVLAMVDYPLTKESISKNVEPKKGVYQIRCYNKNKPLKIGRLLNKDKLGILSIGRSSNINKRLKQFANAIKEGRRHSSGKKYWVYELDDKRRLGKYKLRFAFKYTRDYKREEARLLIKYEEIFGEMPPLNNQEINRKYENLFPRSLNW